MGFGVEKRGGASQPPGKTCREDRHDVKLACEWDASMSQRWFIHSHFHLTATVQWMLQSGLYVYLILRCIHMQPRWGDREPRLDGLARR